MKKLGIKIGWVVVCVCSAVSLSAFAEETPPKQPSQSPQNESNVAAAAPTTSQPGKADSDAADSDAADSDATGSRAKQSEASQSSKAPAQTTPTATPASISEGEADVQAAQTGLENRPESNISPPTEKIGSGEEPASVGGTASTEKKLEFVPEAVVAEPSALPSTRVGIAPSDTANKKSEGNRKILVGTWTKNIVFATEDNSFRFQPKGGVQAKFALAVNSDKETNKDEPLNGTGFSLQRARFGFQASFLRYAKIYLDTEWKTGKGDLLDYFVDFGPNNGDGAVAVRVGRFRPYMARQSLQSSFQLAMIESAKSWANLDLVSTPSDTEMNSFKYKTAPLVQRELGIGVQGFVANGIEYGVGLWNGEDGYATDADFMYGGRIAVHPFGLAGGSALRIGDESDSEILSSPALSIGAAASLEDRNDATIDLPGVCESKDLLSMCPYEDFKLRAGLDIAFKYAGVSLVGEFFILKTWAKNETIQKQALETFYRDAPGLGGYFQAGYMIVPKRFEIVGRFDALDENVEIRGVQFYPTVGVSYFILGNNLKAQFQYRVNVGTGYKKGEDALYMPLTHDILFMLQASI